MNGLGGRSPRLASASSAWKAAPVAASSWPIKLGTYYLNPLGWAGNSDEVMIDKLSRGRDVREVLLANHRTGAITKAYAATDPAWVVSWVDMEPGGLEWVRGSETFVIFSERDGWRCAHASSCATVRA